MSDPITAEVVRNFMDSAATEMYETLYRTAQSPAVNEGKDCAAGIYSYDGVKASIVARAGIILHSFAGLASAQTCLDFFRGDLDPGDVLLVADPHFGGSHIGDYTILVPVFFEGRPEFFTATRLHVADQGGPYPSGFSPDMRDIWHEGFRPGPMKLYERGQRRREIWDWLEANNRLPALLEGDLGAMLGASRIGDQRIRDLAGRYGLSTVLECLDLIFDHSERLFRERVREWPDGEYGAEIFVDSDNAGHRDLKVQASVTIAGDRMAVDFAGTSDQTDGVINSVAANTISNICVALSVLCPKVPINAGLFRSLEISLPERSLVNAKPPAATRNATIVCGGQVAQAFMKACEQFAPEQVGNATLDMCLYFAMGADQRPGADAPSFFYMDPTPTAVSNSGTYGVDGWGCWAMPYSVASPVNIEMSELQAPVFFQESEYGIDSAAPGRWRGSPGYVTRRSFPNTSGVVAVFAGNSLVHPLCGYAGGYEGTGNLMILNEGGDGERICEDVLAGPLDASGTIFSQSGGGGGWGDPLERDPGQVLDDVLDEYVSVEGARADYGVIVDLERRVVLEEETARERAARKADGAAIRRGVGREWVIERAGLEDRVRVPS